MRPSNPLRPTNPIEWALTLTPLGLGLVSILPCVIGFFYVHPSFDDMWFLSLAETKGIHGATVDWLTHFSGRFSSIYLDTLAAGLFRNLLAYRLLCAANFLLLVVSVQRLFRRTAAESELSAWSLSALVMTAWLSVIPGPSEGFYWFTGSAMYVGGCTVALYAIARAADREGSRLSELATFLWLIAAMGMNELNIMIVMSFAAFASIRDYALFRTIGKRTRYWMAAATSGALLGLLLPGSWERVRMTQEQPGSGQILPAAIGGSYELLTDAYTLLIFSPMVIIVAICLASVAGYKIDRRRHTINALSILSLVMLLFLVLAMIVFYRYTQGIRTIARILNVIYLVMIVGTVLLTTRGGVRRVNIASPVRPVVILALLLGVATYIVRPGSHIRRAYSELAAGEWQRFDAEMTERAAVATSHPGRDLVVKPISTRPWTMFVFDIPTDRGQRYSRYYANFYGVRSIRTLSDR